MNEDTFNKLMTLALNQDVYKIHESAEPTLNDYQDTLKNIGFDAADINLFTTLMRACYVKGYKRCGADIVKLIHNPES